MTFEGLRFRRERWSARPGLLIVGAGHAHLEVIRRLGRAGVGEWVTIVEPEDFWYSGLATGMLGGRYAVDQDRVDAASVAARVGARFVRGRVVAMDPEAQTATVDWGEVIDYEVASLDVGSRVPVERVRGMAEHAFTVKPIRRLAELRADLGRRFRAAKGSRPGPIRVLVVGGGPTACEVAANLVALADRNRAAVVVTLCVSGDRLIRRFPEGASESVAETLEGRGVAVRYRTPVRRVEADAAVLDSGERVGFDVAIGAIGLVPSALVASLGLPTTDDGSLVVDEYLRCVCSPTLFAGGDCAAPVGLELEKIGVVAVRQAKVLAYNLRATLAGRPLRRYRPRRRHLLILNLGDGTGLARWGSYWYRGRSMLWWKDALDRAFLMRFVS